MTPYINQRIVHNLMQTTIMPWARADKLKLALAGSQWPPHDGVTVTTQLTVPPAPTSQRSSHREARWTDLHLDSVPDPLLMIVLDGEADIRIGTMLDPEPVKAGENRKYSRGYEVSVYSLPAQSCLLIPPHIAIPTGTPHWERPFPEKAHSEIFWIQVLPNGAIVHLCQTKGLVHLHTSSFFVRDLQLLTLMYFMLDRARHSQRVDDIMSTFLLTLLLCFEQSQNRSLLQHDEVPHQSDENEHGHETSPVLTTSRSAAFNLACLYIGSHLTDVLTPAQIARHAHISVSQLSRIFHAQVNMPVMKYVAERRLEEAKDLLLRTNLNIHEICQICGYPHRTHFSRVFKEQTGISPQAFRRRTLTESP